MGYLSLQTILQMILTQTCTKYVKQINFCIIIFCIQWKRLNSESYAFNFTLWILNDQGGFSCSFRTYLVLFRVFRCLLFPKPVTDQVLFLDTHYSKVALVLFPSRLMVVLFCSSVSSFGLENPMKVIKDSLLYHRDVVSFFDMANQLENSTIAKILLFLVSWMPVTSCFLQLYGRSWNLKVIPLLCVKAYAYRRLQSFLTSS